jgi:hypothetical protein
MRVRPSRSAVSTLLTLALLAALAVGCRRKEDAQPAAGRSGAPDIVAAKVAPTRVVDVALTGTSFQVEGSMAPGPVRFHVRNVSTGRHSFAVDGIDHTFKLEDPLAPGASGTLDVELPSGSFRIRCPLAGHTEPPRQLIVTQRAARP